MDRQPDDLTATDDLTLLQMARSGDRLAFGVLYLRHHAAAWRIACVTSRFSPDAELAVIEGFTRVFSALPAESEDFERAGVTFRPYLLACVRQAALDRARAAGRAEPGSTRHASGGRRPPASPPPPAPLAGLTPDGEVVLSCLEHHVARGALAALPERSRTAVWLSDVEAMTPAEVGGILDVPADVAVALADGARAEMLQSLDAAQGHHEVRADCRFTVDHLGTYHAGTLDPKKGVLVRSHLDLCPPCRMRLGELADGPATLAAAVPAAPLLGGEAQQHWVNSVADARPADRLLAPGLAAAAPTRHFPDVHGHARDRRTRRIAAVATDVPVVARKVGRTAWRAVPTVTLVVAWLGVMLSLPQLMQPETAPGPGGLALPAVQAYIPDYLPGAAKRRPVPAVRPSSQPSSAAVASVANSAGEAEVALSSIAVAPRSGAEGSGPSVARPAAVAPQAAPLDVGPLEVAPLEVGPLEVVPAVAAAAAPVAPLLLAAPAPAPASAEGKASKAKDPKPKSDSKAGKKDKPRDEAKRERKSQPDEDSERSRGSERRNQPVSRGRIVTA